MQLKTGMGGRGIGEKDSKDLLLCQPDINLVHWSHEILPSP